MGSTADQISGLVVSEKKPARLTPVEVGRGGARASAPNRREGRAETPQDPASARVGGSSARRF
jgi:hypothetical protein